MSRLYSLVFVSGFAALSVEVVWSRVLHRLLGSGSMSSAIVLAAFLGGVGLGAFLAERVRWRLRPLLAVAAIEVAAACGTAGGSLLFLLVPDLFRASAGELTAVVVTLLATLPLGAGFPLLLRVLPVDVRRATRVRRLYGLNAFGCGVGALVAGLLLVPLAGERVALVLAGSLQLVTAALFAALARSADTDGVAAGVPAPHSTARRGLTVRAGASFVFLSGFVVLFWEVLWMRLLVLVVGGSVFAFATVAASVILGIALGSVVFGGRVLGSHGSWVLPLAVLVVLAILYPLVDELPRAYLFGVRHFGLSPLVCGTLGAGLVVFLPNALLGSLFPWFVARRVEIAGSLWAINSLGAIVGAFAAGPLAAGVVPLDATYRFGLAGVGLLAAAGIALGGGEARAVGGSAAATIDAVVSTRTGLRRLAAGLVAASSIGLALASAVRIAGEPRTTAWDYRKLTSGVYQWSLERLLDGSLDESLAAREIRAVVEGREVIVTAEVDDENRLAIQGNGKVEGSVPLDPSKPSHADLPTQLILGAAGGAFGTLHPGAPCLLIGLGSGVTLGALAETRSRAGLVAPIDVVEIEPAFLEVIELPAIRDVIAPWFDRERIGVPLRWHFGDARRALASALRHERYSVIVSQPSEPWLVGAAPLFTVEFFREASSRLEDGGVFVQWVQIYRLDVDSLRLLLRTFQHVFPQVIVLRPPGAGELVLLGSEVPVDLERLVAAPRLERQAASGISSPIGWLVVWLLGPDGVRRFCAGAGESSDRLNSDDRGELEFRAPRALAVGDEQTRRNLVELRRFGGDDPVDAYIDTERRPAGFLRRLARGNLVLGDLAEARAILDGDASPEADALRSEIDAAAGREAGP